MKKFIIALITFSAIACATASARAASIMDGSIKQLIASKEANDKLSAWLRCTAIFTIEKGSDASKKDRDLKDSWELFRSYYSDLVYSNVQNDTVVPLLLLIGPEYMNPIETRQGWKRYEDDRKDCQADFMTATKR